MAFGSALHARLPASTGTVYLVDGQNGDSTNGGTSDTLRSSGTGGNTTTANVLTDATAAWTTADVGHGIAILVGATWNYRKITGFNSATSITYNGTAVTSGTGRTWRLGGAWKVDQDFYDKTSPTSPSPAPGDICKIKAWFSTLNGSVDASQTTLDLAASGTTLGLPASGTKFSLQLESEAEYSCGPLGATNGATNTLTDTTASWDSSIVGKQVWIQNQTSDTAGTWEQRTVSSVTDATHLVYSGSPIATATDRAWRVINIEVVTVTSWTGTTMTVTRGTHSSMASSHASGVRVDIPYTGKRGTSYTDTGARHVVQSAGLSNAPFTVMNYEGHDIYFHPNADTTVGTLHETLNTRSGSQYWVFKRNPAGGSFTVERARVAGGGVNTPNIYISGTATDVEIDGLRSRFSQAGSGVLTEDGCARCHKYRVASYWNDLDLNFNHHGFYEQGNQSDTVCCIGTHHAYGNGIQVRSTGDACIITNGAWQANRGIPGGGATTLAHESAGIWNEGQNLNCAYRNNVTVDNHKGMRGSTGGTGSGNTAHRNIAHGNGSSSAHQFTNANTTTIMLDWDPSASTNFSTDGSGTNDNLSSDPKLAGRYTRNYRLQADSPGAGYADETFVPELDFEYAQFVIPNNGPYSLVRQRRTLCGVGG